MVATMRQARAESAGLAALVVMGVRGTSPFVGVDGRSPSSPTALPARGRNGRSLRSVRCRAALPGGQARGEQRVEVGRQEEVHCVVRLR